VKIAKKNEKITVKVPIEGEKLKDWNFENIGVQYFHHDEETGGDEFFNKITKPQYSHLKLVVDWKNFNEF